MRDFESDTENLFRAIFANQTLNIAEVCLGFEIYDFQLPDIFLTNFLYHFQI